MAAYRPQNYDRVYHGPVSVRTALANSYNIPAVKVLDRIGVDTLRELATQAGIRSFTGRYGLALTLGGGDVRLLELTAAYGIFDDGRPLPTQAIVSIQDAETGESLFNNRDAEGISPSQRPHPLTLSRHARPQVLSPRSAYLITDILADDVARQPAFGSNSILNLPFPAAVKTGTTTDWRDNWTVGYSTRRLVGVWVGNADNSPMVDVSGVDGAGPIWHDLMLLAHPAPPPAFPRPDRDRRGGDLRRQRHAAHARLPAQAAGNAFSPAPQPTQPDNQFQRLVIDRAPASRPRPPRRPTAAASASTGCCRRSITTG